MIPKNQDLASVRNLQKEGNQLSDEGKIVQAIEKYQQALQINPEFFPALNRLAVVYENNQEFDLAVAYNQQAIQIQPDCAIAYARLGRIMMKQGEMEKAIDAYEKSVSLPQPPNWVYLELGNTLEKIGQMEKALDLWQRTAYNFPFGQKWIASEFNTRDIYKLNQFYFLQNLPFIGIISSYNLKDKVAQAYQIQEVVHYAIPPERPDTKTDCLTSHYPDAFDRINSELKVPFTGAVFLVGAGLFGKFYCHLIKQRGGIAIDVGSLLDGWAGLGRPHIASFPHYQL